MDRKLLQKMNFSIEPVTEIQEISSIISKARVRIFYTGLNRNLTYITEEFAEKLLKTLPYTPVGGLWDDVAEDFTDHGGIGDKEREKFRAFGVVPENPNFAWEDHLDSDGVLRRYACCDVYLWTARFQAAREIPKKAQSMELYIHAVQGQWKRDGALEYFEFTDGCFFGLTALGEDVEPCFEGAAFYGLDSSAKEFFEELKNYTLSATKEHIGGTEMETNLEQNVEETPVVEDEAVETPAEEIVEETTEETAETVEEVVEETEEPATEEIEVVEETEEITTEEPTEEVDTAAEETTADDAGADTFAEVVEEDDDDENNNDDEEDETVNYQAQVEELQAQISEYENTIAELRGQVEELTSYRNEAEKTKKTELINKYSSLLGEEIASEYASKVDTYTFEELKSDISVKVLDINEEALFSKDETKETVTDVDVTRSYSGAARLMSKYFK